MGSPPSVQKTGAEPLILSGLALRDVSDDVACILAERLAQPITERGEV